MKVRNLAQTFILGTMLAEDENEMEKKCLELLPLEFESITRYRRDARADVVRVSKFPESCGTVDGLPSC